MEQNVGYSTDPSLNKNPCPKQSCGFKWSLILRNKLGHALESQGGDPRKLHLFTSPPLTLVIMLESQT